jgi:UDP:flavonoid glycosyltransferase YjiC (YdhE family)
MARVLFAWELGGDLGHARRIFEVARAVRALGHETAFAFQDLLSAGALPQPATWFQAPLLAAPERKPGANPVNPSQILLFRGFGDALSVAGAMRAWHGLIGLWKPDLLVADYAPGALIAARAAGLAHAAIGSGFSMPPAQDPMPALRAGAAVDEGELRRADTALLAGVRGGLEHIRATRGVPTRTSDIFRVDANLLCTWPEIDPFGAREAADYLGPQDDPANGTPASWRGTARPRVFAYLKPRDARFAPIVEALAKLPGEAIVVAPGLTPAEAAARSNPAVQVLPHPVALAPLLADADLCICSAGPGTVAHALAAGVPLALLPEHFEQLLVGQRVVAMGAGVMAAPQASPAELQRWLTHAATNDALRQAAADSPLRGRKPASAAARIAALLER